MTAGIRREAATFDEAALAALASVGLIRRAAKLDGVTSIETEGEATLVVLVGDERVTFATDDGLANARCSCPTVGPCQHLVAAILHLRDDAPMGDDVGGSGTDRPDSHEPAEQVVEWLLSLGAADLRTFAGTPGLRWALARLDTVDDEFAEFEETPAVLVRLPVGGDVRFMGPSLASAFCDPATGHDHRQIVLAVLVWQRRAGRPAPTIEPRRPRPAATVIGRPALVETATKATHDAMNIGIAHLSGALQERFEAIAIDARGAKLYRLGHLSARVAAGIEDLGERRASADAGALLADLALLHVVAETLASRAGSGEQPPAWLAGVARAEFTPIASVSLLALGAYPWQTGSGYVGVTGVFYDETRRQFVELGGGRRADSMNPGRLYRDPVGWQGGPSLETMRGRRLRLTNALTSSVGRLSTSSRTSAELEGAWTADELTAADWDGTLPRSSSVLRGEGRSRWASLRIDEADPPVFDQVHQRLMWPIRSSGHEIIVSIPWSPINEASIDAVEGFAGQHPSHLIGRLWTQRGQVNLTPVSAVLDGQLDVLAFDQHGDSGGRRRNKPVGLTPSVDGSNRALEQMGSRVLQLAERGLDDRVGGLLSHTAEQAAAHGFTLLGRVLRETASPPVRLLRAAHLVEEHRHFVG